MQEIKFLYKEPEIKKSIFAVLFCSVLAIFMYYFAREGKNIDYKGIHLSHNSSLMFHWSFFILFTVMSMFGIYILIKQITRKKIKKFLVFKDYYLSAYQGISDDKLIKINYSDIVSLKLHSIKTLKTLQIKHKNGYLGITNHSFSESDFVKICSILASVINQNLLKNKQ